MFENADQFYPTPRKTVHDMIKGLKLQGKTVLDPMAGDGAILDVVKSLTQYSRQAETFAIEIDHSLQAILRDKDHQVIDTDFFQHRPTFHFDFILMNPPFSIGAKSLLYAFKVSNGALIKCLLNAETINNPYSSDRQQLTHLIEKHDGTVESLGYPFKNARIAVNVETVLVTLQDTTARPNYEYTFDGERETNDHFTEDVFGGDLAPSDLFDSFEAQYRAGIVAFEELLKAKQKIDYYLEEIIPSTKDPVREILGKYLPLRDIYNRFNQLVTRYAWDSVFSKTKLWQVTTEAVRKGIADEQRVQGQMAFSAANMKDLFYKLMDSKEVIMLACVLEVFDDLTRYHDKNREYIKGWKTNNAYFVGKRVILPNIGSEYSSGVNWQAQNRIEDIEKSLCFLSGKRYEDIIPIVTGYDSFNWGEWNYSEFFKTKLHKVGTMHFEWIDENLRQHFNAVVAQHRWNFLPEKIKDGFYV